MRIRRLGVGGANRHAAVKRPAGLSDANVFKKAPADALLGPDHVGDDVSGIITTPKAAVTAKIIKVGELLDLKAADR